MGLEASEFQTKYPGKSLKKYSGKGAEREKGRASLEGKKKAKET